MMLRPSCLGVERRGPAIIFRKGTNGVSTNGVTAIFVVFLTEGLFSIIIQVITIIIRCAIITLNTTTVMITSIITIECMCIYVILILLGAPVDLIVYSQKWQGVLYIFIYIYIYIYPTR